MELTMTTSNNISRFSMTTGGIMCEACNVQVHQNNYDQHINGKKHKMKQEQYDKKYKTIFVPGTSKFSAKDLEKIFYKYGEIYKVQKPQKKPFAFIQFVNKDSVEKALRGRVFAGGVRLFVHRYNDNKNKPDNPEGKKEKSRKFSETLSNTSQSEEEAPATEGPQMGVRELPVQLADSELCPGGEDVFLWLVQDFISQVELSAEMYHSLDMVMSDVENLFMSQLPGCQVIIFGSCGSTLAFKNSDVDLFLQAADGEQPEDFVRREAKEMYRSRYFRVIARIPSARVPIVKFEHLATGWQGDLTANSQLGVCNSQLIKFLVSLDPRIRPLIMMIKYWAKVCGITGSQMRLTTYSLVMLVIFYLQQLNPPVLPTIAQLQQMTQDKQYSLGWQCSFCDEDWRVQSECLPQSNNLSLREILKGFFTFYYNFDFNDVICPLLGKSIPVKDFDSDDGSDLPDEMLLYKEKLKNDPKCKFRTNDVFLKVQDPFELCLNITRNVAKRSFLVFKEACKVSLELCEKEGDCTLLKGLFSIDQEALDKNDANFKLVIPFKEAISVKSDASESVFVEWYEMTTEAIMLVLKEILKFTVEPSIVEVSSKIKKLESSQDVHTPTNNLNSDNSTFICGGNANVWNSRRKISKFFNSMNFTLNPFEREVCISNSLYCPDDKNFFSFTIDISSPEDLKKGGKGIEMEFNFKKFNSSLVKGFINFMKYDFKIFVFKAVDFINKVKSSSATTGVKESLKELIYLNLSKIPDLKELKQRKDELFSGKETHSKIGEKQILIKSLMSDNKSNKGKMEDKCTTTTCLTKTDESCLIQKDGKVDTVVETPTSENIGEHEVTISKSNHTCAETKMLINDFFKPKCPDQVSVLENSDKCSKNEVNPFLASIEKISLKKVNVEDKSGKQDETKTENVGSEVENEEIKVRIEENKIQGETETELYKEKNFNLKNYENEGKNTKLKENLSCLSQDKPEEKVVENTESLYKNKIICKQQSNIKISSQQVKLCKENRVENIEVDEGKGSLNSEENKSLGESYAKIYKEKANLKNEISEDKNSGTNETLSFSNQGKFDESIIEKEESLARDKTIKEQKSNFKISSQRPGIYSERPPKQKKPNRNTPCSQTQLWVGGGPPGCQQWSGQPPHDNGGRERQQRPYPSREIQRQQQCYPSLFRESNS